MFALRSCASRIIRSSVRQLSVHEHSAKGLLAKDSIAVQRFEVASSADEAFKAAQKLAAKEYVVKAAILAGGRGKGTFDHGYQGGVQVVKTPEQVRDVAQQMIGHRLRTKQTRPEGVPVRQVMVGESVNIAKEAYFAIVMDRKANGPVMIASSRGGMDIEQVAEESPEHIFKEPVDIATGPKEEQALRLAKSLGFKPENVPMIADQFMRLYRLFAKTDSTQLEINPFAETSEGNVICVDAKFNFDDNAEYRQKEVFAMRDTTEEDAREVEAAKFNLNFVSMDGNIGCLVNGAGLAMATMDIIKLHGGEPANFLDVGGGAGEKQVVESFKILTADPKVKAILVNVFGGIVRCDIIAQGIISAAKQVGLQLPLVVRLAGTNMKEAKTLLANSGLPIITADNLEECAKKAVAAIA